MDKDATIEQVGKMFSKVDDFIRHFPSENITWYMAKLQEYANGLFERSPFQKGGRVRLTKTPEINSKVSWGWLGAKHFLVKGAQGTIKTIDYQDGKFRVGVLFDNETWKSSLDNKTYPVKDKSIFLFNEDSLEVFVEPTKFYIKIGSRDIYLLIPEAPAVGYLLRNTVEKATSFASKKEAQDFIDKELYHENDPYGFQPEIVEK